MPKEPFVSFDHWLAKLPERLQALDTPHLRLFIASCCERTQANYATFSNEVDWGDPILFREAGDILWRIEEPFTPAYLSVLFKQIEKITPDTEDFTSPLVSAALDAAVSLLEAIEFLIDSDPKHAISICGLTRETIQMAAEASDDTPSQTAFDSILLTVDLETEEVKQQRSDLQVLSEVSDLTPQFVSHFCRCATQNGASNLGLRMPQRS